MVVTKTILHCNAKINIGLRILGRRSNDGYHCLETIFQEVNFSDELLVESGYFFYDPRFRMRCSNPEIPCDERNLVMKAAKAMLPFLPDDLYCRFYLKKRIPVGAGLGGGSSNAAAVLSYLNDFAKLPNNKLLDIAVRLGADVPFFLTGGCAYAGGIGDVLEHVSIPSDWAVLLVFPGFSISTAEAYSMLRISLTDKIKNPKILGLLKSGFSWQLFENDFEKVIIPAYPKIGEIKAELQKSGSLYAGLSGSGSTVFGIYDSCEKAKNASRLFDRSVTALPL